MTFNLQIEPDDFGFEPQEQVFVSAKTSVGQTRSRQQSQRSPEDAIQVRMLSSCLMNFFRLALSKKYDSIQEHNNL
jgi:hypothetical protein